MYDPEFSSGVSVSSSDQEAPDSSRGPSASDNLTRQFALEGMLELQRLQAQNQSSEALLQGQFQEQSMSNQSPELPGQTAVELPSAASPDTTKKTAKNIPDDDHKLSFKKFKERHPDKTISRSAWQKRRKLLSIGTSRTAPDIIKNIPKDDWQLSFADFTKEHSDKTINKSTWQKNRKLLSTNSSIPAPDTIKNIPDDDSQLTFEDITEKHSDKTISNSTSLARKEKRKKYESYPSEDKDGTYAYNEAVMDQSDKKFSRDDLVRIKRLANEGKINLDNMTGESFDILYDNDQALMKRFFSYLPSNAFEILEKRLGTSRVKQKKGGRGSKKGWKRKSEEEQLTEIDVSKGFGVLGSSGAGAESSIAGSMMSHPPTVPPQLPDVEGLQDSRGVTFVIESGEPELKKRKRKRKSKSTTHQSYPAGENPPRPDVPGMFAADPSSSIFNLFFPDSLLFDVISFSGSPSGADMTTITYTGPDERLYYSGFIDKDNNVRVNPQPQAPNFSRVREALQAAAQPGGSLGISGDLDTEMHVVAHPGPSSSVPSALPSSQEGTRKSGVFGEPFSMYSRSSEAGSSGVGLPKTGISYLVGREPEYARPETQRIGVLRPLGASEKDHTMDSGSSVSGTALSGMSRHPAGISPMHQGPRLPGIHEMLRGNPATGATGGSRSGGQPLQPSAQVPAPRPSPASQMPSGWLPPQGRGDSRRASR